MSSMKDILITCSETVEDRLCEELCMAKCQRTYELAAQIVQLVLSIYEEEVKRC